MQRSLLPEEPVVQHPIDAVFHESIRLIGYDLSSDPIRVGSPVEVTLFWEVLQPVRERWWLHTSLLANLEARSDRNAVDGLYAVHQWVPGHRIVDHFTLDIPPGMDGGSAELRVGFRQGDRWMPVSRQGEGALRDDGTLSIGTIRTRWFPPVYTVRRASGTIRMDGRLDDLAWRRALPSSSLVLARDGLDADPDLETTFRMLWDDDALYVGIEGADQDIWATHTERDANLWEEEVFELFLDPGGEGGPYVELQINPLGTVFDALFPSASDRNLQRARQWTIEGLETAVHVDGDPTRRDTADRSWSAEIRIPWAALPGLDAPPADGRTLRANVYRYERPAEGEPILLAWSAVGGPSFHRPSRFGQLVLRGEPRQAPARPTPTATPTPTPTPDD